MTISNTIRAKGQVSPSFINLQTGEQMSWDMRNNTLSYDASRAVAYALGGNYSLVPNRIGIIYSTQSNPAFGPISREQSWTSLEGELRDKNLDIHIQPFCHSPSFQVVQKTPGDLENSTSGHSVTFHAHSDDCTSGYLFSKSATTGDSTSNLEIFNKDTYIHQAVLLSYNKGEYTILARVSLAHNGEYRKKPEGFELALDWTVKFF